MTRYTELNLATRRKTLIHIDENRDFKGSGGEKKVYLKGGFAYGIYHDPINVIPLEKCKELSVLTLSNIIRPQGLLFDNRLQVGESMLAVQNPWVLCSLFTMAFQKDHGITPEIKNHLSKEMNKVLTHAHEKAIYIVDNNENNWLISHDFQHVYAIDTGNWQTKNYPSRFIMLNIKDPFNPPGDKADWYAQAILLASLYIGKHPFEATHPDYENYPKADGMRRPRMEAMMKDKVAFFSPKCRLNRACFPLDSIPKALKRWMESTLMGDLREPAPLDFETVAVIKDTSRITSTKKFDVKLLFTAVGDILRVSKTPLHRVIITTLKWFINEKAQPLPQGVTPGYLHITYTDQDDPILAWIEDGKLKLYGEKGHIPVTLEASQLLTVSGRLIAISGISAIEVSIRNLTNRFQPSFQVVSQVMDLPNATKAYTGCLVQNMLGSWRVNTFPSKGKSVNTRLPSSLEDQQIVDAKYEGGALMVVTQKKGIYSRYLFFEDSQYQLHLVKEQKNVANEAMNWTVNNWGTMTQILEDGKLEAMHVSITPHKTHEFLDDLISTDFTLSAEGYKTHFFKGNHLYSLAAKP
jgi:hypothetical protein